MTKLFYLPLEALNARYTAQLCNEWMPRAFDAITGPRTPDVVCIEGEAVPADIRVGSVLDATGRGQYALSQVARLLSLIAARKVSNGDIIYLQDFWTPGIEAVFYALHLYKIKVRWFAMVHAQSVDEYDFTHSMQPWIRKIEKGYYSQMEGLFVASTIHKHLIEQCWGKRDNTKIHVVGLPIDYEAVHRDVWASKLPDTFPGNPTRKSSRVIYTSRLDSEKRPRFLLEVIKDYLAKCPYGEWIITTSAPEIRSDDVQAIKLIRQYASKDSRLKIFEGLKKSEYYGLLKVSGIQFNCALQDFVSWTLLEAAIAGCEIAYPEFRSFLECVPPGRLYDVNRPSEASALLCKLATHQIDHRNHASIAKKCSAGRLKAVRAMLYPPAIPLNIWTKNK